jgi:hypothetical protein
MASDQDGTISTQTFQDMPRLKFCQSQFGAYHPMRDWALFYFCSPANPFYDTKSNNQALLAASDWEMKIKNLR